ncbi:MAG: gliding motility-associated C-terminal domain-containing protein [Bacteroidales bacterium]|nr:gliding motility-associated C-terminal domain-containing protein [Bacteroidales bacterium]
MKNLKDYKVQPDEGLFEKIERRVRRRRMARVAGGIGAFCAAAAVGVWVVSAVGPQTDTVEQKPLAVVQEKPSTEGPVVPTAEVCPMAPVAAEPAFAGEAGEELPRPVAAVEGRSSDEQQPSVAAVAVPTPEAEPQNVAASPSVAASPVANAEVRPAASEAAEPQHPGTRTDDAPSVKGSDPSSRPVHYDNIMWAPNIIVPSGDVDENRTFKVKFTSEVSEFRIVIFNRGGRQVFNSTDPAFEWDGTGNGGEMPQGAYVWVAKFRDSDNRPRQEKGTVVIVR